VAADHDHPRAHGHGSDPRRQQIAPSRRGAAPEQPALRRVPRQEPGPALVVLDANPAGGFKEIDQLAIAETSNPAFATGFGDLSVHEVEVPRGDPNEGGSNADDGKLAYFSWYAGGFRVAKYDKKGITEVGHYIDPAGNNFWGVALAEDQNGNRIVLASDRDFGLFIFRYTGP